MVLIFRLTKQSVTRVTIFMLNYQHLDDKFKSSDKQNHWNYGSDNFTLIHYEFVVEFQVNHKTQSWPNNVIIRLFTWCSMALIFVHS